MTGKEINSCKKCVICTGCGRGADKKEGLQAVSIFRPLACDNGEDRSEKCYVPLRGTDENALMVATDIGTTTIVMQLRRMGTGEVVDSFRCVNPQRKYGLDVLSRIQAAEEIPGAGAEMHRELCRVLEQGIRQFRNIEAGKIQDNSTQDSGMHDNRIQGMVIAANTTMVHLLMGYPVDTLGKEPFASEHLGEIETKIAGVNTIIMPGISAFVGADILAGLYAFGANSQEAEQENFLFLDLGTNGEIVLGTRGEQGKESGSRKKMKFLATATAAGPAFEGRLDANVWGADAVGFLAKLCEMGLVDETGLLADEYFEKGVSIGSTIMTQEDIRSIQLAKAAVHAGIRILCEKNTGKESTNELFKQIDKVYLAGGFGYFLNPEDAVKIGLIPRELETKCIAVGNAALEGAFCYGRERLCENPEIVRTVRNLVAAIPENTEVCNLAKEPKFEKIYIDSINLF